MIYIKFPIINYRKVVDMCENEEIAKEKLMMIRNILIYEVYDIDDQLAKLKWSYENTIFGYRTGDRRSREIYYKKNANVCSDMG